MLFFVLLLLRARCQQLEGDLENEKKQNDRLYMALLPIFVRNRFEHDRGQTVSGTTSVFLQEPCFVIAFLVANASFFQNRQPSANELSFFFVTSLVSVTCCSRVTS